MTKITIPPEATRKPHKMVQHGHERIDDYYWLRDDKRSDPAIIQWLNDWNNYTDAQLKDTEALQGELFEEMVERVEKNYTTVPYRLGDYYYMTQYEEDKEYPIFLRQKKLDRPKEVILDANLLAKGEEYFSIAGLKVSPDGQKLVYAVDTTGRRVNTIYIKDLKSGQLLQESIAGAEGDLYWTPDSQSFFYIKKHPETLLGYQVYRHRLNTAQSLDKKVYEESNPAYYTGLSASLDGKVIYIGHYSTNAIYYTRIDDAEESATLVDLFKPEGDEKNILLHEDDHRYLLMTDRKAKNNRIVEIKKGDEGKPGAWRDIVAHRADVLLTDALFIGQKLLLVERQSGLNKLRVMTLDGKHDAYVEFEQSVFSVGFTNNYDQNAKQVRLYYSNYTTPVTYYDLNLSDLSLKLLDQRKAGKHFKASHYVSERTSIVARDGAQVPVSILYRKDRFKKDGTNPTLIYGYGSYGHTIEPGFRSSIISLLDRGFVYAIAHIRGSKMLGQAWYDDGKMFNKKNTFTDFIDVTKAMVAQKYADKDRVFASGGSAGGLLMGAVINMAPDLYRGVGAHVPFVDVVTTMSDPGIPLTTNEYGEWGNPANKDEYFYMLSYSPYDQVEKKDYPNLLVTTGFHDSQVQYFEPAKWVAKLQAMKTDTNKLLFRVDMEAGHSGASGRFKGYRDTALEFAFFISLTNLGNATSSLSKKQ